jgi:TubC N-terminal docking domain
LSAAIILKQAADCGVKLTVAGDQIAVKVPRGAPTSILANIRKHKPELLAILRNEGALIAAEQAKMDACEARFQDELVELRAANAAVYANPQPWRAK